MTFGHAVADVSSSILYSTTDNYSAHLRGFAEDRFHEIQKVGTKNLMIIIFIAPIKIRNYSSWFAKKFSFKNIIFKISKSVSQTWQTNSTDIGREKYPVWKS